MFFILFFLFVTIKADLILFPAFNTVNNLTLNVEGDVTNPCPVSFTPCGINTPIPVRSTDSVNMISLFNTSENCYRYVPMDLIENQNMQTTWGQMFNGSTINISPVATGWWTGSYTNGTRIIGNTCGNWTTQSGNGQYGNFNTISNTIAACANSFNVMCGCLRNSDSWSPTQSPTNPSRSPSNNPSRNPTNPTLPTNSPTNSPSKNPTNPSRSPTNNPSKNPSRNPSRNPSKSPSLNPTMPTQSPTFSPSHNPSKNPSRNPSKNPTQPSLSPSQAPTKNPSRNPSRNPTKVSLFYFY